MTHAIAFLKEKINSLVFRITEIESQIGPLVSEKEELESIAREIEDAIKKLAGDTNG